MKKIHKLTLLLLGILLILSSACGGTLAPDPIAKPQVALESCQLSSPGLALRLKARCGKLTVYENRQAGSGRQIALNIAVIPAVSRNPAPDSIFYLAGGPGEAATESYPLIYTAFQLSNQKRDIVLVDQRGTGKSHPLTCQSLTETDTSQQGQDIKSAVDACLKTLDADPRLYTTSIAMDDLDQVRAALGYEKINLYGASYGTRAALVYARQHPEHLRTMILDGVVPLNWTLGPAAAVDAQRSLDLIFSRCSAETTCREAFPGLNKEFTALLKELQANPVKVSLNHPLTGEPTEFLLTQDLFASLVHTSSYAAESVALLPIMIHTAYTRQDYSQFAALWLSNYATLSESISEGMRSSVICAEDAPFMQDSQSGSGYLGEFVTRSFLDVCQEWPRGEIPADFKEPVQSNVPTLLLSGEADPITPPANAELAAQTLTDSLQIVVPGQGHGVIFRGCLPRIANNFIDGASLTGLDTSCVKEMMPMPFFLNLNGPQS